MIERVQGQMPLSAAELNLSDSQNAINTGGQNNPDAAKNNLAEGGVKPSKENVQKVVDALNDFVSASNTHIQFKFHEKLKEYYVTVVNDQTNEVVKEIPSKKLLDIYAEMNDWLGISFTTSLV